MLFSTLRSCAIRATDGDIGHVEDLIVDTRTWQVRYLVADTRRWLPGKHVLLAAKVIEGIDTTNQKVSVCLAQEDIKNSPDYAESPLLPNVDNGIEDIVEQPYSWALYLGGRVPMLTWPYHLQQLQQSPSDQAADPQSDEPKKPDVKEIKNDDSRDDNHLASLSALIHFRLLAKDGELGHVEDFILNRDVDEVLYPLINDRNWLPGKTIVLPLEWIKSIESSARFVSVGATQEQIQTAPEFDPTLPLESALEQRRFEKEQLPVSFLSSRGEGDDG